MTVLCTIFSKTISETRLCTNVEQTNFVNNTLSITW